MTASPNFPKLPHGWVEQTYFINNDQLFLRLYQNTQPQSRRGLFILHGHSEQGDRYEHFPYYLQNTVDHIVLMDLPGHGFQVRRRSGKITLNAGKKFPAAFCSPPSLRKSRKS